MVSGQRPFPNCVLTAEVTVTASGKILGCRFTSQYSQPQRLAFRTVVSPAPLLPTELTFACCVWRREGFGEQRCSVLHTLSFLPLCQAFITDDQTANGTAQQTGFSMSVPCAGEKPTPGPTGEGDKHIQSVKDFD